jgi:hypothetical protein
VEPASYTNFHLYFVHLLPCFDRVELILSERQMELHTLKQSREWQGFLGFGINLAARDYVHEVTHLVGILEGAELKNSHKRNREIWGGRCCRSVALPSLTGV